MDDTARIACCLICLVADRLKACDTCAFNIGLEYKVKAPIESPIEPIKAPGNSVFSQDAEKEDLKP